MSNKTIIASKDFPLAQVELFELTQDMELRLKWDKQTKRIEFIAPHKNLEKGCKVLTESVEGVIMETEYLTYIESEEISIKMLNPNSVFKSFNGKWNYISINKESTSLRVTYQFKLKSIYFFIAPLVHKKIRKNMMQKLNNLESYIQKPEIQSRS